MSSWSRAKDAWIAEHCEGLEVLTCAEAMTRAGTDSKRIHDSYLEIYGDHWIKNSDDEYTTLGSYLTDPAAAIRAARGWATKNPEGHGRQAVLEIDFSRLHEAYRWNLYQTDDYSEGDWPHLPGEWEAAGDDFAGALAQALLRATGGPA